jgi:hypothetical protein
MLNPIPTTRAPTTIPATAAVRRGEAVMVDQADRMWLTIDGDGGRLDRAETLRGSPDSRSLPMPGL